VPGEYLRTRALSIVTRTVGDHLVEDREEPCGSCCSESTISTTIGRSSERRRRWVVCTTLRAAEAGDAAEDGRAGEALLPRRSSSADVERLVLPASRSPHEDTDQDLFAVESAHGVVLPS
jgi:hypothetical protein